MVRVSHLRRETISVPRLLPSVFLQFTFCAAVSHYVLVFVMLFNSGLTAHCLSKMASQCTMVVSQLLCVQVRDFLVMHSSITYIHTLCTPLFVALSNCELCFLFFAIDHDVKGYITVLHLSLNVV